MCFSKEMSMTEKLYTNKGKKCSEPDCDTDAYCRELCKRHYGRFKRHGDPKVVKQRRYSGAACSEDGCDEPAVNKGYCSAHGQRFDKCGTPKGNGKPLRADAGRHTICKVPGCSKRARGKELCVKHRANIKKHKSLEAPERTYSENLYEGRPKEAPKCRIKDCKNTVARFLKSMPNEESSSLLAQVCSTHYQRLTKTGSLMEDVPVSQKHKKIIEPEGVRDSDVIAAQYTRHCGLCDTIKSLTEFTKLKNGYYGRASNCSSCLSALGHKRRVSLREGDFDKTVTKEALFTLLGYECFYCGETMVTSSTTGQKYDPLLATYEHIVPVSKGGGHTFDNVVLACWRCNCSKNAMSYEDFLLQMGDPLD